MTFTRNKIILKLCLNVNIYHVQIIIFLVEVTSKKGRDRTIEAIVNQMTCLTLG